jgi:hypothetical protein
MKNVYKIFVEKSEDMRIRQRSGCKERIVRNDVTSSRSQWPRDIRHEEPSSARTQGSWFRIPFEDWMSGYVYSLPVLFCVQVEALRGADLPSKEFYDCV